MQADDESEGPSRCRETPFRLGGWRVIPSRNLLENGGDERILQPKIMQLLCTLAAEPGTTLSRSVLMERVWEGVVVSDAAIDRAVCTLRKALGDAATSPHYIETVRKKGIRLMIAPVTEEEAEEPHVAEGFTAAAPAADEPRKEWRLLDFLRRRSHMAAAIAVALGLALTGGLSGQESRRGDAELMAGREGEPQARTSRKEAEGLPDWLPFLLPLPDGGGGGLPGLPIADN